MLASNIPGKVSVPFANSGTKNAIPVPSQIGVTPGLASYTDGFPPLTFTPLASGGVPPFGADFNGFLNAITQAVRWACAGGQYPYDAAFSTAVSGYPLGAIVQRADGTGEWLNLTDGNTTNPEAGGAGWVPMDNYGITAVTGLTNSNVTLTALQYARNIITLSGALTGNIQIIFPTTLQQWVVINGTTGAFAVTCKTLSGTGASIPQGGQQTFYGDGLNLVPLGGDSRYGNQAGGQCRLALVSGSLKLTPYNGNRIIINGVQCTIPAAGVNLAATGLTPSTFYYIYAVATNNIVTSLEASTTGYATDPNSGFPMKNGDLTRALVGAGYCTTGPAWVDTVTTIGVLSYFNRRAKLGLAAFSALRSTASVTYVELNSEIRINYINWADAGPVCVANGAWALTIGGPAYGSIGIDAGLQQPGGASLNAVTNATDFTANYNVQSSSEGVLHFATLAAAVPTGGGTVTFIGSSQSGGQRVELQLSLQG